MIDVRFSKDYIISKMMKTFGFDYETSLKIYNFYDKRNEIHIVIRDIKLKEKNEKEKIAYE